ncbi:MAG TPA: class I SAM-dependent methyltransferase [Gaiellaceae bacterium]|jgi:SAM-dependent methyltransferase|nr:class I SAM-dependent methyltransferase [Gaiellaceae bacterium]
MMRTLGMRFARLTTDAVVRRPSLWPLFRGLTRTQFDRIAPVWDHGRDATHLAAYEAALAAIDGDVRRALDVGTGTGDGALALARRFPAAEVVGVDLAEGMLELARRKAPELRFERADASRLPFPDGSFEVVAHANMIPFFDEVERVTAPGGWALFAWSVGPETPIYVPPQRLRSELAARGFTDFADFAAARGTSFLARKR